jgi:NIMA (never in mitosis gene a)-related kinase
MKELNVEGVDDVLLKGFETEIEVYEALPPHPNIIRYLYHERKGNAIRLYMTRYAFTLGKLVNTRRIAVENNKGDRFSLQQLCKFLLEIATGLDLLKKHKIIHRDLKTENIFVTLDSHSEVKRLTIGDFDSAKRVQTQNVNAKTTIGTPGYMAPEVITAANFGAYSFAADVWSFGMIMFELLTLRKPFEGIAAAFVPAHILASGRPQLSKDLPDSYKPFIRLYEKCTQMDPHFRPGIADIKDELSSLMWTIGD